MKVELCSLRGVNVCLLNIIDVHCERAYQNNEKSYRPYRSDEQRRRKGGETNNC